jgi:hypothetical protein
MFGIMALRDKQEIAEKLYGYADKLTGFSILQSISFAFAFATKDFRDIVYRAGRGRAEFWVEATFAFYVLTILICMLGELKLLGISDPSTPEGKWTWFIRIGRFCILSISYFINSYALDMMF